MYKIQDLNDRNDMNNDRLILTSDKRVAKIKKDSLLEVLPTIIKQETGKLNINLNDLIKSNNDINDMDVDMFLNKYVNGSYKREIIKNNYIGMVLIKFNIDTNNDEYVWIYCKVKIIKSANFISLNNDDKINQLKRIEYELNKSLR